MLSNDDHWLNQVRRVLLVSLIMAPFTLILSASSYAQLRIVTYNTLDKPFNGNDRSQLRVIFDAIAEKSVNGIAKRVDIISLQEQATFASSSTASIIADELNILHEVSSYTSVLNGFGTDRVGFVYDSSTVDLITTSIVPTAGPRTSFRMQFRPVGYESSDADVFIYTSHFKAGSSSSDVSTRTTEGSFLSNNADNLGDQKNILFTGDFNFGSSSEQGYQNLIGVGEGQTQDPLELGFWPSSFFAEHMTQSTRTSFLPDGGATGGNDDRFDLQLTSSELLDGEGISYIGPTSDGGSGLEHSYQAFGNDGVSFNQPINNTFVERSQPANVLNALHDFSDHLPVVADYQLPAVLGASLSSTLPDTIKVNDLVALDLLVENLASVVAAVGADELDYTVSVSGDLVGSFSGTDLALDAGNTHEITLDTSSIGQKSGAIVVETMSLAAMNNLVEIPINFEVVAMPLAGDFDADGDVDGADFLEWQRNSSDLARDIQLAEWLSNFGNQGEEVLGTTKVPEPKLNGLTIFSCIFLIRAARNTPETCTQRSA